MGVFNIILAVRCHVPMIKDPFSSFSLFDNYEEYPVRASFEVNHHLVYVDDDCGFAQLQQRTVVENFGGKCKVLDKNLSVT